MFGNNSIYHPGNGISTSAAQWHVNQNIKALYSMHTPSVADTGDALPSKNRVDETQTQERLFFWHGGLPLHGVPDIFEVGISDVSE
jgi:hypothetical protein